MPTLESSTLDWGLTDYEAAYERQLEMVAARRAGQIEDTLIFTEHTPTFTLGKRKESSEHIVWEEDERERYGITISNTNRGGDVTYHGPGQIVGYPIIDLSSTKDLHLYLRNLEQVLINALGCLGLATARRPGMTGIWVDYRKIAAMGIAVKQWVSYHGFALNVANDLTPFSGIVPCGIGPQEGTVTSLNQELNSSFDLEEVKAVIAVEFWKIFPKV